MGLSHSQSIHSLNKIVCLIPVIHVYIQHSSTSDLVQDYKGLTGIPGLVCTDYSLSPYSYTTVCSPSASVPLYVSVVC